MCWGLVPGFVSCVLRLDFWMLGLVFWVLGFVFWVLGFVFLVSFGRVSILKTVKSPIGIPLEN